MFRHIEIKSVVGVLTASQKRCLYSTLKKILPLGEDVQELGHIHICGHGRKKKDHFHPRISARQCTTVLE